MCVLCCAGEAVHTAALTLNPGRYLIRFLCDGEWKIDENREVIVSLGEEYNTLYVDDPEDSDSENGDYEGGRNDEDALDELDEGLSGLDDVRARGSAVGVESIIGQASGGGLTLTTTGTKGMITITPKHGEFEPSKVFSRKAKLKRLFGFV